MTFPAVIVGGLTCRVWLGKKRAGSRLRGLMLTGCFSWQARLAEPSYTMMETTPPHADRAAERISRHVLLCCLPQVLILLLLPGLCYGGWWLLLPVVFLQIVVPALDMITGWQDDGYYRKEDFTPGQLAVLSWNTRLYALLYMAALAYVIVSLERFTLLETGVLIACFSLLGGIGFGAAHEILHAKEDIDQRIQRLLTSVLFYPHYKLIHIRSHHVHASTEHDENTAWLDENIYSYIVRTIPGSMIRSWQMEASRPVPEGLSPWQAWFANRMRGYAIGQVVLLVTILILGGVGGLLFYLAHVLGAHVVLESVNYIQHYGLMRRMQGGEYEKTGPEHSWDTYHYFSSYITFRVGHHSHHHLAVKPYYLLDPQPDAPKLPVGYFWAIAVVLLPPWWRQVIHPRLGLKQAAPVS